MKDTGADRLVRLLRALPVRNYTRRRMLMFARAIQRRWFPADWMRS